MGSRLGAGGDKQSKETYYRVAFSVSIKAPKGYEISFEKNRTFIRWLREQGFSIKSVSMDTYQSAQIKQQLESNGFNTKIISVDRLDNVQGTSSKVCLPYAFLKSTIYEKRLELYQKCDLLTDEIVGLERESDGHIQHPAGGTQGSKDQIDAVTGSLWNASQNIEEYAYDYGEDYETTIAMNSQGDSSHSNYSKEQMVIDFENELKQIDPLRDVFQDRTKDNNRDDEDISYISNDTIIW